ncbi:alpha/beta-hydrolase [Abortiporus biennis]|nr:alpha/beta-hydrolase [Abortiporus biennis]
MNTIATLTTKQIFAILPQTIGAFLPLLKARVQEIDSVERRTFKYGETDRHQLDVYYPPSETVGENTKAPVIFHVYGGGWASGDRVFAPPADVLFRNVGAYFAKQGFFVAIADYRLIPIGKFPDPVQDLHDAIQWVNSNVSTITSSSTSHITPDLSNTFLTGHSAGGANVISLLLLPSILPLSSPIRTQIKAATIVGGPFHSRSSLPGSVPSLNQYYGPTKEDITTKEPLGLLEVASEELLERIPDVLILTAENEPDDLAVCSDDFERALKEKTKINVERGVLKGHNHISPFLALSSGEGEEFGLDIVKFFKARVN